MNASLAESVLSRYPLPRATRLLDRFRGDATVGRQLDVLSLAEPALTAEGLSLKSIPRPILIAYLQTFGAAPLSPSRQFCAEALVSAARSFASGANQDDTPSRRPSPS